MYYDKLSENKQSVGGLDNVIDRMDSSSMNSTEGKEKKQHQFINHIQNLSKDS
jgi:hypothetical protein